jgi:hypothetical protein
VHLRALVHEPLCTQIMTHNHKQNHRGSAENTQLTSHDGGSQMYGWMVAVILEAWEPHDGGRALHCLSSSMAVTVLHHHKQQT